MTLENNNLFTDGRAAPGKHYSAQRGSGSLMMMGAVCMVIAVVVILLKLTMNETYTAHTGQVAYEQGFNQANNLLQSVSKISDGIEATTVNGELGSGISTRQVAEMRLFPIGSVTELGGGQGVVARNELGGLYAVSGNAERIGQAAARTGYFIYLTGIPENQCPFIVNSLARRANEVWVGPDSRFTLPRGFDSTAMSPDSATQLQSFGHPMTVPALAAKCSSDRLVTVVVFKHQI